MKERRHDYTKHRALDGRGLSNSVQWIAVKRTHTLKDMQVEAKMGLNFSAQLSVVDLGSTLLLEFPTCQEKPPAGVFTREIFAVDFYTHLCSPRLHPQTHSGLEI